MIKKTYLIILSVAIVSVLLGSLLYNNITQAQSSSEALREYDPFKDPNQDGIIDIFDVGLLSSMWSTTGEPINTTALLLDLLDRVEALENQSTPLGYIGPPAYDSGWVSISHGETMFTHNLGTTELFVYILGKSSVSQLQIHHYFYGGVTSGTNNYGGTFRRLTDTTITVYRFLNDGSVWEQVRIMIWKIQPTP